MNTCDYMERETKEIRARAHSYYFLFFRFYFRSLALSLCSLIWETGCESSRLTIVNHGWQLTCLETHIQERCSTGRMCERIGKERIERSGSVKLSHTHISSDDCITLLSSFFTSISAWQITGAAYRQDSRWAWYEDTLTGLLLMFP